MDMMPEPQLEIDSQGTQTWHVNGVWHRVDGPARLFSDNHQEYYQHGRLYRPDGPTVIRSDGTQEWWQDTETLHRTDGPAVIRLDGHQEWFVNGEKINLQVITWMQQKGVHWPWDALTQAEFLLTWT